jgi:hypothetical protein
MYGAAMSRKLQICFIAALLFVVASPVRAPAVESGDNGAGKFDFYVLSLS